MSIAFLLYQAETSNGGRMTNNLVNSAGSFPAIHPSERAIGIAHLRKLFLKIADVDNTPIVKATVFLKQPSSSANTRAYFMPGTQRDTAATMGTPRKYGTGVLHSNVSSGATSLIVDFETGCATDLVVQAGDTLFIRDNTNEEIALTVSSVAWTGEQATIGLVTGTANAYLAGSFVGSCLIRNAVNTSVDNLVKNFSSSTFDEIAYPIQLENISTIEQTISLIFTGANTFSVISDKLGSLPNGSTLTDYSPVNTDFSLPYLTIPALTWGGSGTIGETLSFQTHPSTLALFINHQVYPGAGFGTDLLPLAFRLEY